MATHLELYNFRKFKSVDDKPGLSVSFHRGLNALIGENDSGKTAIIDAIKLVLLTQSSDYIRAVDEDFYTDPSGVSCNEFRIELILADFTPDEAKNFIEYLSFEKDTDGKLQYFLRLYYRAWKEKSRVFTELRAGAGVDGITIDSKARELLKTVYLKPLRDAEHEMRSGRNSRISQILINHPVFIDKDENELVSIIKDVNEKVEKFFTDDKGKAILSTIRKTLAEFLDNGNPSDAKLTTAEMRLKAILETLSLTAPEFRPGLGELNLLFIAAELLLLDQDTAGGLKLALIEELEAHLHPQAQLRLINYLQKEYQNSGVQIIISTHSTILASKINLKNIVLAKNGAGFDLSPENTRLFRGDYLFLQRFLDSTKANLFFAKGIIMVEGDAENLFIPVLADIIGYPLEKYGISLVNVGNTAFLRYSRIFARADGSTIGIPVSVVTDCDVRPYDIIDGVKKFNPKDEATLAGIAKKEQDYSLGCIKAFVAPRWTFEYSVALSCLSSEFHRAIHCAKKINNSDKYTLTKKKLEEVDEAIKKDLEEWKAASLPENEQAFRMYGLMLNSDGSSSLKSITAQCLAALLRLSYSTLPDGFKTEDDMFDLDLFQWELKEEEKAELKQKIEQDDHLSYLVRAIKHAANVG